MLSEIWPAIAAAALWAISSRFVNAGLVRITRLETQPVVAVGVAMAICLVVGTLTSWMLNGFANPLDALTPLTFLAGLLTFPIATGIYYVCAAAYTDQAEIAAQYANVKPLMSIGAGVFVFGEALDASQIAVIGLIVAGVAVLLWGARGKRAGQLSLALGLALAVAWAAGEICVRAETGGQSSSELTLAALFSSTLVSVILLAVWLAASRTARAEAIRIAPRLWHFAAHGVLSFGIAYGLFFYSIRSVGLSATISMTVFWPTLAFIINWVINRLGGRRTLVTANMLAAMALLTAASLLHVLALR